ncbi:serine/threonine-protein kinase [Ruania rhizosphaerae]|uniref:serine/threonine-protein kinase n=1 Tax=Ruania rhizosphaerae TaxID=1840413 RepID=UPI00135729D3|nr:serine/threonine-protein kinase [Ruania rhizosphaerae]
MSSEFALGSAYTLTHELGSGALGTVYRGHDQQGRAYAFKLLRSEYAADPAVVQRFIQERSALTAVQHPNVVRTHDLVVEGPRLAIVMDLVTGGDLRNQLTQHGPLAPADAARLMASVASGLTAVHQAGIVHRDLKPENILLSPTPEGPVPQVSDFGIAHIAETSGSTRTSVALGTPNYMAPEILAGEAPTPTADVYALGIITYELLCGLTPFEGGHHMAVIRRHADMAAGRPPGVPDPLWGLLEAMLTKAPTERPSTHDVAARLSALAPVLAAAPAAARLSEPPAPVPLGGTAQATMLAVPAGQSGSSTPPTASAPMASATPTAPPGQRKRRKRMWVPVIALAVLIAAITTAVLALGGNDPETNADPGETSSESTSPDSSTVEPATNEPAEDSSEEPSDDPSPEPPREMPEVVGLPLGTAMAELEGVEVTTIPEIHQDVPNNEVIAQSVAEGEDLPVSVELTVASQPATVYLAMLDEVDDRNMSSEGAQIDAEDYPRSVVGAWNSGYIEYNLSRSYQQLLATVGRVDSASDAADEVQVTIFLDQREVWSERVSVGSPAELDLDVTDALRLRIEYTSLQDNRSEVALGDARLLGVPGEIPDETDE